MCSSLTSITIPNSVPSIGDYAFYHCEDLTSIDIPNSVTSIGDYAFNGCSGLTSITIPNSVTSIGGNAFSGCTGLTSITIPNSVTSIGEHTFFNCKGLTSITIGNSVTSIGDNAFLGCKGLIKAEFASIESLCKIYFGNEYSLYSNPLFYAHHLYIEGEEVTNLIIPNSMTWIGNYTFRNCTSLTSVTIPNSVTSIGIRSFSGCSGLTSITIPNSVTSINTYAFSACSKLSTIVVGTGVTDIDSYAFASCSDLTDVYMYAENVPSTHTDAFYNSYLEYATLHVPAVSISRYKSASPWNQFGSIVALDSDIPETPQCAKPTIAYNNGKLQFSCDTEDVEYVYNISTSNASGKSTDGVIDLGTTFTVSVYATREGYIDSETVTITIGTPQVGDVNGDGLISIADVTALVNLILGRN